ncbi:MAG: alkaline phosphatase family protein [Candidatus Eisenbacteria sp.]|nr:alkaline phosphatase family protein [Candidatus Eisenbacteria bacterium]
MWTAVIALSGAASIAAVRLATPLTLDERGIVLLLFFGVPGLLILLLKVIHRYAGLLAAMLQPMAWLVLTREGSDSLLLWLIPVLAGFLIVAAARCAVAKWSALTAALLSVAVGFAVLLWPGPGRLTDGPRVLLIGVDGARWPHIDTMIGTGKLPHFAQVLQNGHRAKLRSLPSMLSPRVWSTIATGCTPAVHGIEGFSNTQRDFRVGRIWDQLKLEGRSYGLCGWYFTWPPVPDLGERDFVIPSTLAGDSQTFPPEYSLFWLLWAREHLKQKGSISFPLAGLQAIRGGVRLSTLRRAVIDVLGRRLLRRTSRDQFWRSRVLYTALQADIFVELLRTRRPEFGAVLFTPVDKVSHVYWKYLHPEGFPEVTDADRERYGGVIDELYMEVDRSLGKLLRTVREDVDMVIVSDHGFQKASGGVIAGRFCRIRTENLIAALELEDSLFGTNLDLKVYLRAVSPTAAEKKRALDLAEAVLGTAHFVSEDAPLFEVVREEGSLCLSLVPRYTLPREARIALHGKEYGFDDLIRAAEESNYSGVHHPDGIYLLSGPSAAKAVSTDSLHVLDVAPTVAALLGLPVSSAWTGRAALRNGSPSSHVISEYSFPYKAGDTDAQAYDDLKRKLKAIGYLE